MDRKILNFTRFRLQSKVKTGLHQTKLVKTSTRNTGDESANVGDGIKDSEVIFQDDNLFLSVDRKRLTVLFFVPLLQLDCSVLSQRNLFSSLNDSRL